MAGSDPNFPGGFPAGEGSLNEKKKLPEDISLSGQELYERDPYYMAISGVYHVAQIILLGLLVLFVLLSMLIRSEDITYENLFYLFKDIGAAAESDDVSFDALIYDADEQQSFAAYRSGLAVVGSRGLTVFTATGRQTLNVAHNYLSPRLLASDKYLLVFGQGEKNFALYNSFARLHTYETEGPIFCGAISSKGWYAVACQGNEYNSVVMIYNESLQLKVQFWKNSYVTALDFDPSGKWMMISCVSARDGHYETELEFYRVGENEKLFTCSLTDFFPLKCTFLDEETVFVCGTEKWLLLNDASEIIKTEAIDQPQRLFTSTDGFALLTDDVLTLYDKTGNRIGVRMNAEKTKQVIIGAKNIYILDDCTLYCCPITQEEGYSVNYDFTPLEILMYDEDKLLVCSGSKARYVSIAAH